MDSDEWKVADKSGTMHYFRYRGDASESEWLVGHSFMEGRRFVWLYLLPLVPEDRWGRVGKNSLSLYDEIDMACVPEDIRRRAWQRFDEALI